jgi:RNA recognition motif-containing protein
MSRKLFVGNLPYETTEQDLEGLFGQAGQVETVSVMRDRMTGRARGFAFVEMASDDDAQKAITQFNGHQMGGRALTVNEARPQAARPGGGGGGGYGGGGGAGGRGGNRGGGGRPGRRTDPRW